MIRALTAIGIAMVLALAVLGTETASAESSHDIGRIVLWPGMVEVRSGGHVVKSIDATVPLEFTALPDLVGDSAFVERRADGTIDVHVPIEQRPGSRLAITGGAVHQVRLIGGARLSGSSSILSISNITVIGTGTIAGKRTASSALIGYDGASGVRMSRVHLVDDRSGTGAGRAVDLAGGQLRIISALISGGAGAVRLNDVGSADVIGVQIEGSRGTGLAAGGATALLLRDVTVSGNAGDGLALSGRALRLTTGGEVALRHNHGLNLQLSRTRGLDVTHVRSETPGTAAQFARAPGHRAVARVNLAWPMAAGLILLLAAVALEATRARRDHDGIPVAPDYVLNR